MASILQAFLLLQKAFEHLQLTVKEKGYSPSLSLPARHFWLTCANWKKQRWPYIAVIVARHSKFAAIEADGEPLCIQDAARPRPGVVGVAVREAEGRLVLLPVRGALHPTAMVLQGQRGEGSLWAQVTALHTSGHCLGTEHRFMGEILVVPAFDSLLSDERTQGGACQNFL